MKPFFTSQSKEATTPKNFSKSGNKPYEVGYGRPPKKSRFKKGQTANPAGINGKEATSIGPDLKAILERALNEKIESPKGEPSEIITTAAAGIRVLVEQFVRGEHRARRDLIALAEKLGVDLMAGQGHAINKAIAEAVSVRDEALLAEYVQHQIQERLRDGTINLKEQEQKNEQ